jgi:uracil-DNA glycosylase
VLFQQIPDFWRSLLAIHEEKINEIGRELARRADLGERILPDRKFVFRALEIPPDEVKVIIIGQDPYPNAQDACGLSFSVSPRKSGLPGSLMNIQKEILTDLGSTESADGDLTRWADQGVMLLNRVLTVSAGESGSHAGLGWEAFTRDVAQICADKGTVALLWGNSARELAPLFREDFRIEGVHPSPLSAHRGFLGSKPFSAVNRILQANGKEVIRW